MKPTGTTTAELSLSDWHQGMTSGALAVEKVLLDHLQFVQKVDKDIQAFVALDEAVVREQACQLASKKEAGEPLGPLFGVPVGLKDIIETEDLPTANGSPIYEGKFAIADATVTRRLRNSGAVVFGKTATTEFATFHPAKTRNPHNTEHTPGGSSSGSAAAVAAGLVPVALGTQTNGSVIRPASFCGVYGFKPSYGLIPRTGIFEQSDTLDQVGFFARSLVDIASVAQVVSGDDGSDLASRGLASYPFLNLLQQENPVPPRFCFVKTPWWDQVSADAQEAYEAFLDLFEGQIVETSLPDIVTKAVDWHSTVNEAELAATLSREWLHHRHQLSPAMQSRLEKAHKITAYDYLLARSRVPHVRTAFEEFFDRYDAILSPAALGAAPNGLQSTGNPIMQTVWTFGGLPSVSLPFLSTADGLPLGVQAVGAFRQDGRLLRSLQWLVNEFDKRSSI